MDTKEATSLLPADVMADAQIVARCIASGQPVPLEVARRIQARAERIRQEILAKHGQLDLGVPIIREMRGDLADA